MAFTIQKVSEVVEMCPFHTWEPTLGHQCGGRPAIYQNNTATDWLWLVWSLPFRSFFFGPSFLVFLSVPQFMWLWFCLFQCNLMTKLAACAFCLKKIEAIACSVFLFLAIIIASTFYFRKNLFYPPPSVLFRDHST